LNRIFVKLGLAALPPSNNTLSVPDRAPPLNWNFVKPGCAVLPLSVRPLGDNPVRSAAPIELNKHCLNVRFSQENMKNSMKRWVAAN
jgi:hypothetical protein